jgi:hypothetical protein
MKLTKRKGFNFFRSYYDVYNELTTDKEKVDFLDALLDRQFLGIKPTELTGMAKFAYISQTNSIDSQVKGYEDKIKVRLDGRPYYKDDVTPTDGGQTTPTDGVNKTNLTPTLQEEEKGEVEEEEKVKEKEKLKKSNELVKLEFLNCSETFFEQKARQNKIEIPKVKQEADRFWTNFYEWNTDKLSFNNVRRHFANWLDKQEHTSEKANLTMGKNGKMGIKVTKTGGLDAN